MEFNATFNNISKMTDYLCPQSMSKKHWWMLSVQILNDDWCYANTISNGDWVLCKYHHRNPQIISSCMKNYLIGNEDTAESPTE